MSAGSKQSFLRNCQKFVLDDTDHVLQIKVQEILQWMSSSSISWTKGELPFNVQKLPACQACNWLQSKTSWLPLPSKIVMCCIYFIRNTFYLFSSHYQMHVWVPEAILMSRTKSHLLWHLFSSLKWSFWKKIICPPLTTMLCWPAWSTPRTGCVRNAAPDMDRQLPLQPTANMTGIFISCISPSPGQELFRFYQHTCIAGCMSNFWMAFEADSPLLGLILLLLSQGQNSTPLWQRQKHPQNLKVPMAFSKSFMKVLIFCFLQSRDNSM